MDNSFCCVIFSSAFIFFVVINGVDVGASQDECTVSRCGDEGPDIQFPFWLKDRQPPDHSGCPGFGLSCTEQGHTILELPSSVKIYVKRIDYESQVIRVYDPDGCLPKHLPNLNLSASPFQFQFIEYQPNFYSYNHYYSFTKKKNYTLFNCSSADRDLERFLIPCTATNKIYAIDSSYLVEELPLSSCGRISRILLSIPYQIFDWTNTYNNLASLGWTWPINCEAVGKRCIPKNNPAPENEGFYNPEPLHRATGLSTKLAVTGGVLGLFFLVLAVIGVYCARTADKIEKENQVKIKKFLEDYKALKPTRYSYADIKRITNQFKDKVGQGGYGTVFKGKLSNEILVAVKILNESKGNGEEFINEVGTMGKIHHVNVVRLVGYCADGFKRALIYEFLPNESLEKFIFSADIKNHSLGWEKLQDIALGIAKGIEYLHQGCDQRILHFDIKPHNILLDHNFNPKISDFGLAKLCSKEKSVVSMTAARGTMGYIAPEVFSRNFGNVSYKSDVYSFGMLLLEMVGGRKNVDDTVQNTSQVNFPEWIYNRLDQGEELEIRIEEEGDAKIGKKLTIVGLWCIQWYPVDRPSMRAVVQMLEGEGDSLTMPPNPFATTNPMKTTATMPGRPLNRELEVISE